MLTINPMAERPAEATVSAATETARFGLARRRGRRRESSAGLRCDRCCSAAATRPARACDGRGVGRRAVDLRPRSAARSASYAMAIRFVSTLSRGASTCWSTRSWPRAVPPESSSATLRPWLRRNVRGACAAGRRGVRLRLPGAAGAESGTGHPLTWGDPARGPGSPN